MLSASCVRLYWKAVGLNLTYSHVYRPQSVNYMILMSVSFPPTWPSPLRRNLTLYLLVVIKTSIEQGKCLSYLFATRPHLVISVILCDGVGLFDADGKATFIPQHRKCREVNRDHRRKVIQTAGSATWRQPLSVRNALMTFLSFNSL